MNSRALGASLDTMCGSAPFPRAPSLGVVILAAVSLGGCVRYYAGAGYASSWQGARATGSQSPAWVMQSGAPTEWASASTATTLASSGGATIASVGTDVPAGASDPERSSLDAPAGAGAAQSVVMEIPGSTSDGPSVVRSLGGLCAGGAPIEGEIARLADLRALPASGAAHTLYADSHVRVSASLAHDALPARGGETSLVVALEGLAPPTTIPPLRVHLVIDASTSMEGAWPDVKEAALAVVRRLRPEDELQIVVYGTDAREVLAPVALGDGRSAREVIRRMGFGGRTNIESGLRRAYGACRPAGRSLVIVVSDGVPQGGRSGADELGALAAEAHASHGAVTLAIGLGTDFHTGILTAIGRAGGGELLLAPRSSALSVLLDRTLAARGAIVASDLDARITALPGVTIGAGAALHAGALTAGETRSFVVPLATSHTGSLAHVRVSLSLADGRALALEASLSLGDSPAPVSAGAISAVLDLSLAEALRAAGREIENGRGAAAEDVLRAHVATARASMSTPTPALEARNEAVLRIAAALPTLVAEASWGARRQASASFAARSFEILAGR